MTPVAQVMYAPDSRFPVTIDTEDGRVGLTIEEAQVFMSELIRVLEKAIVEDERK